MCTARRSSPLCGARSRLDVELSGENARAMARHLDRPHTALGVDVKGGHVWHVSLSLRAEEGIRTDAEWQAIASDFVTGMEFDDNEGTKAACRWAADRHGVFQNGNDHVHRARLMGQRQPRAARPGVHHRPRLTGEEPEAERAEGRIRDEVRQRYGGDVANTGTDPDAVLTTVRMSVVQEDVRLNFAPSGRRGGLSEEAGVLRQQAAAERHRGAAEEAEAVNLITTAEAADRSAEAAHAAAQREPGQARLTLTAEELALVQDGLRRNATDAARYTTGDSRRATSPSTT